jgi:hypothetical protein
MGDTVQVEVTRIIELKEVVDALRARGLDPQIVEDASHLGIEIPCDDLARAREDVYVELETWIAESGSPLIPMKLDDGTIFLRPASG